MSHSTLTKLPFMVVLATDGQRSIAFGCTCSYTMFVLARTRLEQSQKAPGDLVCWWPEIRGPPATLAFEHSGTPRSQA